MSVSDMPVCRVERSEPLSVDERRRRRYVKLLVDVVRGRATARFSPVQAYAILYNRTVPLPIQKSVHKLCRYRQACPGFVYVVTHRGIGVPNVVKIGLTRRRSVEPRMHEHARMLGLARTDIIVLAAISCRYAETLERIIHRLLRDDRQYDLVCVATEDALTEYFRVADVHVLEMLIRACAHDLDTYE